MYKDCNLDASHKVYKSLCRYRIGKLEYVKPAFTEIYCKWHASVTAVLKNAELRAIRVGRYSEKIKE